MNSNNKTSYYLDLDHSMGYNGNLKKSVLLHPNLKDYIYIAGGSVLISEMNDSNNQSILRGHDDEVTCVAISSSGKLLASEKGQKGKNSDILVWDFEQKKLLYKLSEHDYEVTFLEFSKDEKLLFSAGNIQDKKIFFWDMTTGYIVANHNLFPAPLFGVTFGGFIKDQRGNNTSNYQIATCGSFAMVLWNLDPKSGTLDKEVFQTGNFAREYICMTFSTNGEKYIYAGTTSGDFVCFQVKNKMVVFTKIACAKGVTSIVALDNNQVVIGGGDGSLALFYVEEPDCQELMRVNLFGAVFSISPSVDNIQMLASTNKGFIYRIRCADLSKILLNENHTDNIISFYSSNDSSCRIGSCSLDGTIRLWNLAEFNVYSRFFLSHTLIPWSLHFTDEVMISGWNDGKIRSFRCDNCEPLWTIDNAHKGGVTTLCFSHNKKFICSGGTEGEVRVWETRSKDMVSHLKEHIQKVTKVGLFKDDLHLLTTAKDKSILIWDLNKEKRISSYQQSMGGVNNFQLSPRDENFLVTIGQDRKITFWDLRHAKPIKIMGSNPNNKPDQADELFALSISNDGNYVATGGTAGIIRVWDFNNYHCLFEQYAHSKTCNSLSYTFDDKFLISAGADAQILAFRTSCYN